MSGNTRTSRALVTGAAVAVLAGALVGGSTLGGGDGPAADSTPFRVAAGGAQEGAAAAQLVSAAAVPEAVPASGPAHQPAAPVTQQETPPWQDGAPPAPETGMEPENPDWPNAWEIPDARPTGVDYLEAFGAPKQGMNYPRLVPVSGVMICNTGAEDVEPEAGQSWFYYLDGTDPLASSVDISVTGWADSPAARDALREDTMTFCLRDAQWQPLEWSEHQDDEDYLLYEADDGSGLQRGFAIVRQGDYLVGVTVADTAGDNNAAAAGEIAAKMADNLAALDTEHGRD